MPDDTYQGSTALADALRGALARGHLDAALALARTAQMRAPANPGRRRVVEALELLVSQVWVEGEGRGDSPFRHAAAQLERGDLDGALAVYRGSAAQQDPERAAHLAQQVEIVAAAAGAGAPRAAAGPSTPSGSARPGPPPLPPRLPDEVEHEPAAPTRREPTAAHVEATRVAAEGELPLEELRRQIAAEERARAALTDGGDAELDGLLDELEGESAELVLDDGALDDGALDDPEERRALTRPETTPTRTFGRPGAEPGTAEAESSTYDSDPPYGRRPSNPPIPTREELGAQPLHAPPGDARPAYDARAEDEVTASGGDATTSWTGVPLYETAAATFEPSEGSAADERWDAPTRTGSDEERRAEALVARGELEEALAIYEALASRAPEDGRLWRRIKAIAWMLRRGRDPTQT